MEEDARRRFFAGMEKERTASEDFRDVDDIDFSITESGRTIAHIGTESLRSETDFSIGDSNRPGDSYMLTEKDRDDLLKTLQEEIPIGGRTTGNHLLHPAKPRPIPVPRPTQSTSHEDEQGLATRTASSHGSSGSAFLSSVLNPTAGTINNAHLSRTPPTFGTSYEASHFGKRARSGSISGRLRSASEYLEERGLLDRQTKGILKDLIIIGDEDLQRAIDSYESGDPSKLEEMINSGALQNRLPGDIDILDDIDLDFLTVGDEIGMAGEIEPLRNDQGSMDRKPAPVPSKPTSSQYAMFHPGKVHAQAVSPPENDDGIGDLEFSGDLVSDQAEYLRLQPQSYGSKEPSVAASPAEASALSEYEQRMRSNSLFSALLNEPRVLPNKTTGSNEYQYANWMDHSRGPGSVQQSMSVGMSNQNLPTSHSGGGIGASLEAERKRLEKQAKKEKREKAKQAKEQQQRKSLEAEDIQEHVSGSGLPRTLSDPNLHASIDEDGLVQVDRPEGWVGAYSPESRKVRIERFLQKRHNRVWTKTVKYDVRKNFADSRLRVKGRFVKKEDELLMRELMSLT